MRHLKGVYTAVFFLDSLTPSKIVLLKRASTKEFAAGMYTGVGGVVEEGENLFDAAFRELEEETGIKGIELTHFACAEVGTVKWLHYFAAILPHKELPFCNEGDLEWVDVDKLLKKNIIPTTKEILKEWQKRHFVTDKPFTIQLTAIGMNEKPAYEYMRVDAVVEGVKSA
jgi:8-oxo-dGTP pyrophosphatase MutT (NUDIX family)